MSEHETRSITQQIIDLALEKFAQADEHDKRCQDCLTVLVGAGGLQKANTIVECLLTVDEK